MKLPSECPLKIFGSVILTSFGQSCIAFGDKSCFGSLSFLPNLWMLYGYVRSGLPMFFYFMEK